MKDELGIDKRSSAELSEAINSMWKWYRDSKRCIAYLPDVESDGILDKWTEFNLSEWFTRGWTLQELLAPSTVTFCNSDWQTIGTIGPNVRAESAMIVKHVSLATGIEEHFLQGDQRRSIMDACVAKKFGWAARRKTTRPEDMAYCLLGLLDVNMPLLYGEGGQKAFIRLQQEIIRQSDDESIFAWQRGALPGEPFGLLAPDIRLFRNGTKVEAIDAVDREYQHRKPYSITNKGVLLETSAYEVLSRSFSGDDDLNADGEYAWLPKVIINLLPSFQTDEPSTPADGDGQSVSNVSENEGASEPGARYLMKLNCRSLISDSDRRELKHERCSIVLRDGPGNIVHRIMTETLHPDLVAESDAVPKTFIVKLTSAY
jgi:hypothetical protein